MQSSQAGKAGQSEDQLQPLFDLVVRGARFLDGSSGDIAVHAGAIAKRGRFAGRGRVEHDASGRLVLPGFVDSHIHLDKSCLMDCACGGGLRDAIAAVARRKRAFTINDVRARASRTLERAILAGTTRMRTHVEIDPRVEHRSLDAILELKADYAFAIDLSVCVFPQEGMTNDPGTEALLLSALDRGADLLGGCPYTDTDPHKQIERIFDMAVDRNVDLDFHLDFDLDPKGALLFEICRQSERRGLQGRVAIGHATKLSAMDADALRDAAGALANGGVAVTALPATDLYLNGRDRTSNVPRGVAPVHRLRREWGVAASLATNNVLNPFTPFGNVALLRTAQLYATVMQVDPDEFPLCIELVTTSPARILRLSDYGLDEGAAGDLVVLDAADATTALAEAAEVAAVFKRGVRTVTAERAVLHRPFPTTI
mgnify:CR=1 FL=1